MKLTLNSLTLNPRLAAAAATIAFLTLLMAAPPSESARPGSPVAAFGEGGTTLTGFSPKVEGARTGRMLMESDGAAVVLSYGRTGFAISRFTPDGGFDPAFGIEGSVTGGFAPGGRRFYFPRMGLQSNGEVVLGGESEFYDKPGLIIRYDRSGRFDRDFGSGGVVTTPSRVILLGIDGQDRIVVVGSSAGKAVVSRYLADGKPDRSFGRNGSSTYNFSTSGDIEMISFAADRITIGARPATLRLLDDGRPDPAFGNDGISRIGGFVMTVDQQGRVVYVRDSGTFRRLLADGSPDTSFGNGGTSYVLTGADRAVAVDGAGRMLFGGSTEGPSNSWIGDFEVMRLLANGQLDPAFGGDGLVSNDFSSGGHDEILALSALADGRLLAAGTSRSGWGLEKITLARYQENGDLDPTYATGTGFTAVEPVLVSDDGALDAVSLGNGRIVAVGSSGSSAALAAYRSGGRPDLEFGDDGRVETLRPGVRFESAQAVTRIGSAGFAVCSASSAGLGIGRYSASGTVDPEFGQSGLATIPDLRRCGSILKDESGRLVIAGVDKDNVVGLARLTGNGEADGSFGTGGYVRGPGFSPSGGGLRDVHMDLAPNGDLVIAGDHSGVTVARYSRSGKLRKGFGDEGVVRLDRFHGSRLRMGRAETVDVDPGGRIVIGGVNRKQISVVALAPDGLPIRSFGEQGMASRKVQDVSMVEDLKVNRNGSVVVVGWSRRECPSTRTFCGTSTLAARLDRRGRFDLGFGGNGVVVRSIGSTSKATTVLTGRWGITLAGFAEVPGKRRQFMLLRLKG